MEEVSSMVVAKKKKLKTRKCLDEIRKRSRRTLGSDCRVTSQQHAKNIKTGDHKLITMNRLTLPKAIRSETITRPLLKEIKYKSSYNYQDLDKYNMKCTGTESRKTHEDEDFQWSASNGMPMFDIEKSLHEHGSSFIHATLGNSQSPVHMNILESPSDLMPKINSTSSKPLPSQTFEEHEQELYEELMNNISSHLKNITSEVIEGDLIKTTKLKLLKMYNCSRKEEYQTCMLECQKSNKLATMQNSKDCIAHNALDYIRSTHFEQETLYDGHQFNVSEVFNSLSSAKAPSNGAATGSPLTFASECTRHVALYDTPEYNYYPHRLN